LLQVPWQAAHRNPKAKPFLLLSLPRPLEAKLNTQLGKRKIQGPDSFSDMRQKRYDSTEEQNWIGIPSHQEL
jgi:hypothetical protein